MRFLTRLASIADLKVISRTSVMQYESGAARDLRKIGQQLGVARVVEGSVQRAGNRVRVNAQLIDASTNRTLWGQTYDRDLADVFAIQSEIATSIARQLQASLSAREKTAIEQAPTNDVTAFELYARADLLASRDAKANLLEAADLLNQAVARDPSFFKAYCLLASTHDLLYFLGHDHTPARLALAEAAIEAAFRLHPDAGEAHLARAQNLYQGYLDYNAALAELEVAAKTLPNNASVFELKGFIERRQGKPEEAVRSLQRAIGSRSAQHATRCSRLRSVIVFCAVSPSKNRFWTARWLSSRIMSISNSSSRPWNSIGKLIPARCIKWSIQFGPQIPLPLKTSPSIGFFTHWLNAMPLPQKMPSSQLVKTRP